MFLICCPMAICGLPRFVGMTRVRCGGPPCVARSGKDVAEFIDRLGRRVAALEPRRWRGQGGRRAVKRDPDHGAERVWPLERGPRDCNHRRHLIGMGRVNIAQLIAVGRVDAHSAMAADRLALTAQMQFIAGPALGDRPRAARSARCREVGPDDRGRECLREHMRNIIRSRPSRKVDRIALEGRPIRYGSKEARDHARVGPDRS